MSVSADRDRGRSPLLAVGSAAVLGLAGLFVGVLLGVIAVSILGAFVTVRQGSALTNAVAMIAQGVGLVAVGVVYLSRHGLPASYLRVEWPSLRDLGWTVAATVGLFVVLGGLMLLIQQLGLSATEHSVARDARNNPEVLLPLIPLSVLVTGPTEELLFRGVIQTRLKEAFDVRVAVVLAAAVFSLVHVPAYGVGGSLDASLLTTLGVLFVLGAVLGAAYERAENLVVPAVAHGVYNAVVFGALYAESVGLF